GDQPRLLRLVTEASDGAECRCARPPGVRPTVQGWPGRSATGRRPANSQNASQCVIEKSLGDLAPSRHRGVERNLAAFWFSHAYTGDLGGAGAASIVTFVPVSGHRSPVIWPVNLGGLPNRRLRPLPASCSPRAHGLDVLVEPEEVVRVVGRFDVGQAVVIDA